RRRAAAGPGNGRAAPVRRLRALGVHIGQDQHGADRRGPPAAGGGRHRRPGIRGAQAEGPRALSAARRWRFVHLAVLRPLLTVTALVSLYYLLPVEQGLRPWTAAVFTAGLAVVVLL